MAKQRMAGDRPVIGSPTSQGADITTGSTAMPPDLQQNYLNLAVPGSPLGQMGLLSSNNLRNAQIVQDSFLVNEQNMMTGMMPPYGQLPMGQYPPQNRQGK
jgi:hypothetical protein